MKNTNSENVDQLPPANIRGLVSLALLIHLFIVFVAVSSNLSPSVTQDKLMRAFSPYTQPLNLKLSDAYSYKLFHYTHNAPLHDDHFLEVEFEGGARDGEILRLPDSQPHGSANRTRLQSLARMLAAYQEQGNDEFLNKLTEQGIAPYFLQGDTETRAIVRVRRHAPMARFAGQAGESLPTDPEAPAYFNTLYEASVTVDANGRVYLTKIEDAGQVAPLREDQDPDE